jgi:energy-coupling factor transport system ATP-binding protein
VSISFQIVSFCYNIKAKNKSFALEDVSFDLEMGKIYFLIGHTGSGKSTIAQLINGLLLATSGDVVVRSQEKEYILNNKSKKKKLKNLRKNVGLVFQFPEYQLFEETIIKDVMFGPKNFGYSLEEAENSAKNALSATGISQDIFDKSPFMISGGQKRRVAIAGILAFNPDVLILDEPTAGLDPQGAQEMMELFINLNKKQNKTLIIITHQLDDALKYGDQVLLLCQGKLVKIDTPNAILTDEKLLHESQLEMPPLLKLAKNLSLDLSKINTIEDMLQQVKK